MLYYRPYIHQVAYASISERECGAMEVSNTLRGLPLYETGSTTVLRWVNVNVLCSCRVKENLPADSDELSYPSLIDMYHPNRGNDDFLERTGLKVNTSSKPIHTFLYNSTYIYSILLFLTSPIQSTQSSQS